MPCGYCGMENCETGNCPSCGTPAVETKPRQQQKKSRYATRRLNANPDARFRAKCGFPIKANVLPTIPVQTGSAATPAVPPAPTPKKKSSKPDSVRPAGTIPPDISIAPPRPTIEKIAKPKSVRAPPEFPERPRRPPPPPANRAPPKPEQRPIYARRTPPVHATASSRTVFIGLFVASIAMGLGSAWWMSGSNAVQSAASSVPAPVAAMAKAEEKIPGSTPSTTPEPEPAPAPANETVIALAPPAENTAAIAPLETLETPEQPVPQTPEPPPVPQTSPDIADAPASASDNPAIKTAEKPEERTTVPAAEPPRPKKIAKAGTTHRARKQTVVVTKKERGEEIDRLKTQAFSETTKDRIGNVKPRAKTPATGYQLDPQSARRKSYRPSQSARTAGTRTVLAQCEHGANLFRREQCKWQVCGGKWGEDGCPSYDHKQAMNY